MEEKNKMGIGSLSLLFGLLPTITTASYNGVSIMNKLLELIDMSQVYIYGIFIVVCLIGLSLGIKFNNHWGARVGAFLAGSYAIFSIIQIITLLI